MWTLGRRATRTAHRHAGKERDRRQPQNAVVPAENKPGTDSDEREHEESRGERRRVALRALHPEADEARRRQNPECGRWADRLDGPAEDDIESVLDARLGSVLTRVRKGPEPEGVKDSRRIDGDTDEDDRKSRAEHERRASRRHDAPGRVRGARCAPEEG